MTEVRDKRVLFPEDITVAATFIVPTFKERSKLNKWLQTNCGGQYYLGNGFVSIQEEADVVMFKLGPYYDRDRVQKAVEASPKYAAGTRNYGVSYKR